MPLTASFPIGILKVGANGETLIMKAVSNGDGTYSEVISGVTGGGGGGTGVTRVESLWTDDTGAYFVRVDSGTAISWTDISGNVVSAPGTGARPAAGTTTLLDRSSYVAIATATGYTIGDSLDHLVTIDPGSGLVLGTFWINASTNLKLASPPASANISPSGGGSKVGIQTAGADVSITNPLAVRTTSSAGLAPGTAPAEGLAIVGTHTTQSVAVGNGQSAAVAIAADASLHATLKMAGTEVAQRTPLPTAVTVTGRIVLVMNTIVAAGTRFVVWATAAGSVTVVFADGSTGTYPTQIGLNVFPFAVTEFTALTGTATCENWY